MKTTNNDNHIEVLNKEVEELISEVQQYVHKWNCSNRGCEDKLQAVMCILRAIKLLEYDD